MNPNTIRLIGFDRLEEGRAGGAITPGDLIAATSAGKYVRHGTAGGDCQRQFALEDALQGRTIDDNYATDELVQIGIAKPGDVCYVWLTAGQKVTPVDYLTSTGNGKLKKATGSDFKIAQPLESLDLTSSASPDTRIRARIM